MKARGSRVIGEQSNTRNKAETLANGPSNSQQTSAQAIRKRRSSINVYDQPSSLNARLRQLETDMLRLDEDRTKLFDDTHSALAQYELRLSEIQAILKSRQDNAEKYVEDMKILLQAKDDFERQAKNLSEKHVSRATRSRKKPLYRFANLNIVAAGEDAGQIHAPGNYSLERYQTAEEQIRATGEESSIQVSPAKVRPE